jgi:hypothetical protein
VPPGACPDVALSYCLGRYQPLSPAALARLPLDALLSLRRCELDIIVKAPALFAVQPDRAPDPLDPLRGRCAADYEAIRAAIDARIRLGR